MVSYFQEVLKTVVLYTEDTLWTGVPGNYTNPDAPAALSTVRKLVDAGRYPKATAETVKLSGQQSDLLGDIKLEFDDSHLSYDADTYKRELDLDSATVTVKYNIGNVTYTREHFATYPDQVVAMKISASRSGSVSFKVSLDSKLPHRTYASCKNKLVMEGSRPGRWINEPKGIQFTAVLSLQVGKGKGNIEIGNDNKAVVNGSDWAVIFLIASSSFGGPFVFPSDTTQDPITESLKLIGSIETLRKGPEVATAERVKSFQADEDPSLVELLFQYGRYRRYLLISCSRLGTQVANLQGIWNKDISPPWDRVPHLNINLQMNYWPSLSCKLKKYQYPLFDYISLLSINGRKTAKVSDLWSKTSPDRGQAVWALWPMGGAWLGTHLWEHYAYTLDKAYPLLEGCVAFSLDWLIGGHGRVYLKTNPSTSPEHTFIAPDGEPASVSYSTTMDIAIIKEVFSSVISAAEVLGKDKEALVEAVREAQTRLPPTRIIEWAEDFEDSEIHHRHLSHLFGLFPGSTISIERRPYLAKAVSSSLNKSGLIQKLQNIEITLTKRMVKHLFILVDLENEGSYEGGLYSDLFTAHPPFQIDANFGFTTVAAEIIVPSTATDIHLLPALPRDKWPSGCVKGLKARGRITVNVCWEEGRLHEVGLWCEVDVAVRILKHEGNTAIAELVPGKVYTLSIICCSASERILSERISRPCFFF